MEVNDMKRDLSVTLSGVTLQNPVVPASGCFGFGYGMAEFYDIDILAPFLSKEPHAIPVLAILFREWRNVPQGSSIR